MGKIKNGQYIPYGEYNPFGGYNNGYPIIKGVRCPQCNSLLYMHDGGDQGGIPHIECTNDVCNYQKF